MRCDCHRIGCKLEVGDPRHGTYNGYGNLGCGCPACAKANAAQTRAGRERRVRAREIPAHVHGSPNGYGNWGCRCQPCRDAWAEDTRYRRARRKAGQTDVTRGLAPGPGGLWE